MPSRPIKPPPGAAELLEQTTQARYYLHTDRHQASVIYVNCKISGRWRYQNHRPVSDPFNTELVHQVLAELKKVYG